MPAGKTLRLGVIALGLLVLLSITAPAYGAAGGGENPASPTATVHTPATRSAQAPPVERVDTGLVAGAVWVLLLPLVLISKLKISEARRIAWLNSRPGLDGRQVADLLEDYRVGDARPNHRIATFQGRPLQ